MAAIVVNYIDTFIRIITKVAINVTNVILIIL